MFEKIKLIIKQDLFKYLAGFAAGALLVFLITSAIGPSVQPLAENTGDDIKEQLMSEIESYKSKYDNLNKEYENLQKSLEEANASVSYYKSVAKLYEAESLFVKKDYEAAGDLLLLLKAVDFSGEDKEKFDELQAKVMPLAAQAAYEKGRSLVNPQGKYEEALEKLKKVELFQPDFPMMDGVLYYMGKCYQMLNDSRNAVAAYQKLLKQYPRSSYVKWANIRMSEITQIP